METLIWLKFLFLFHVKISFVEQLASDLNEAGFDVWYDISSLIGGANWKLEIESALRNSQYMIVVLSPNYVSISEWVEREFLYASILKTKIIPLFYRECELPLSTLNLNYIDIRGENYHKNFDNILTELGAAPKFSIIERLKNLYFPAIIKRLKKLNEELQLTPRFLFLIHEKTFLLLSS